MNRNAQLVNEASGRYYLLSVPEKPDDFEMGMLINLKGENIISPKLIFDETKKFMSFDISDCITFKENVADKTLSEEDIIEFVVQLKGAEDNLKSFLLGEENMLLSPDELFVDKLSGRLLVCSYFSENIKDKNESLCELIKLLLLKSDISDIKAIKLCVRLYRMASNDGCRLYDLMNEVLAERLSSKNNNDGKIIASGLKQAATNKNVMSKEVNGLYEDNIDTYEHVEKVNNFADEVSTGISIDELDDENYDDIYESDYADSYNAVKRNSGNENDIVNEAKEEKNKIGSSVIVKIIITQAIMLAGLFVVVLMKGPALVIRLLPLYAILSICIIIYFIVGVWSDKNTNKSKKMEMA